MLAGRQKKAASNRGLMRPNCVSYQEGPYNAWYVIIIPTKLAFVNISKWIPAWNSWVFLGVEIAENYEWGLSSPRALWSLYHIVGRVPS